ncbi:tyrosine-type recombinase/integrase, partial [Tenacibaculum finnmarkense]
KKGLKEIGLDSKNFTAHSLRHTTAINILKAGGSIEMAQFTLRHTNPATTQIYTATLNEERRLENSGEALIDNLY